jgi:hypothetical protein
MTSVRCPNISRCRMVSFKVRTTPLTWGDQASVIRRIFTAASCQGVEVGRMTTKYR